MLVFYIDIVCTAAKNLDGGTRLRPLALLFRVALAHGTLPQPCELDTQRLPLCFGEEAGPGLRCLVDPAAHRGSQQRFGEQMFGVGPPSLWAGGKAGCALAKEPKQHHL